MQLDFDQSLPEFAALIASELGAEALEANVFVREPTGKLTFVLLESFDPELRAKIGAKAPGVLGKYVESGDLSVATPSELFDETLSSSPDERRISVTVGGKVIKVRLVDRRIVGSDWLRIPVVEASDPIRIVFTSIKGGVGRSTALCVAAAHLASRGLRILAIDLDLEAPGLGNMLIERNALPEYGLLDYLVERGVGQNIDALLADIVGSSWLGGAIGRVDIVPALGQSSLRNPANVLAKIARAYLADGRSEAGNTFLDNIREFVEAVAVPQRYDVVLVDARAGLHETTAAALLGLGAQVLCFGLDQPQTFQGYELLISHIATSEVASERWRDQVRFVQSKAPLSGNARDQFAERIQDLFRRYLWSSEPEPADTMVVSDLADVFEVEWIDGNDDVLADDFDEQAVPVIAILDDERYRSFDPLLDRESLSGKAFALSFQEFLEAIDDMIDTAPSVAGASKS